MKRILRIDLGLSRDGVTAGFMAGQYNSSLVFFCRPMNRAIGSHRETKGLPRSPAEESISRDRANRSRKEGRKNAENAARRSGCWQFRASGGQNTAVSIGSRKGLPALAPGSTLFPRTGLLLVVPTSNPLKTLKPHGFNTNRRAVALAYHCWLFSCLLT